MAGVPGPRGPYAKGEARREKILDAALISFAVHGYERASLRDIARRVGLSHAGLLHYFSGKQELLLAALVQYEGRTTELAMQAFAAGATAAEITADGLVRLSQDPDLLRAWLTLTVTASAAGHPAYQFFADRRERARAQLTPSRDETDTEPTTLGDAARASLIVAVMDGLAIQLLADPSLDVLTSLTQFMKLILTPAEYSMLAH